MKAMTPELVAYQAPPQPSSHCGCWWTGPHRPELLKGLQPFILTHAPPSPNSPAVPQCLGCRQAQGGRGHPTVEVERQWSALPNLPQPASSHAVGSTPLTAAPLRLWGHWPPAESSAPGLCCSEAPALTRHLLLAGLGLLCCPHGNLATPAGLEDTWPHPQPEGEDRRHPPPAAAMGREGRDFRVHLGLKPALLATGGAGPSSGSFPRRPGGRGSARGSAPNHLV